MAGYTRQSSYTDGDIINAADSNDEFDQILAAFNNSTGHKHDGTASEGPVIGLIGDAGSATPKNKIVVDDANDQIEVSIDVSGTSTEQFVIKDGVIEPTTDSDIDIGSSSKEFKDLYLDGTATIDTLQVDESATITANLTVNGNTTLGNAATDTVTITADVASNIIPSADNTYDLGASGAEFKDLYIDGVAYVDSIAMPTTTVTDILDEDDMSSNSATALATQQSIKAYVDTQLTAEDLDFQADTGGALSIDLDSETLTFTGGTGIDTSGSGNAVTFAIDSTVATLTGTQTLTNKTLTTPTVTTATLNGAVTGTSIKDEDDMSSDSASHLATQQSIKAYVDSQVASFDTLAELSDTNIATPASGHILIHDGTDSFDNKAVSGDVTIDSNGAVTIANDAVETAMVNENVVSGQTAITSSDVNITNDTLLLHDADASALKKVTVTNLISSAGGLTEVVADTSPQLGGNLDVNGNNIVSVSNGDIDILPNGTGVVNLDGDGSSGGVSISDGLVDIRTGTGTRSQVKFYCESSNAHAQTVQPQPHSASVTNVLTLPAGGDQEIVGTTATQTLTNKTIDASQLSGTVANARLDAELQALAGLTSAADKGIQFTGSGTAATYDLTSAGKALLDDADASAQRTTMGVAIGSDVQAYDAGLASIAGLTTAANKVIYTTASDTYAVADFTAFGRSLVDDADASAARTTLGLGTAATSASADFDAAGSAVVMAIALG